MICVNHRREESSGKNCDTELEDATITSLKKKKKGGLENRIFHVEMRSFFLNMTPDYRYDDQLVY
jgi:hypothetical protein